MEVGKGEVSRVMHRVMCGCGEEAVDISDYDCPMCFVCFLLDNMEW